MNAWMVWATLAGAVVILELFSGTFYLLMISFGLLAGAVAAFLSAGTSVQLLTAAIVGTAATLALHNSQYGWKGNKDAARDPNVNMDIGQTLTVSEWQGQSGGRYTSRAMYRGAMWDVELQHVTGYPGEYVIQEIQGSRLIVRPV